MVNLDKEIQNLSNLRDWMERHKDRVIMLGMNNRDDIVKSITHLEATIKRLKTIRKACESVQGNMGL